MEPFNRYNSAILSIFTLLIFILPDHVHAFSEDLIKSRLSTADSLYQNHQYEASLQILEETLQQAKNRIGENHRLVGAIYNDLGRIHTNLGLYYDAIELHKKALL
jgi:tetratricopeptide (TPR) repeat protein